MVAMYRKYGPALILRYPDMMCRSGGVNQPNRPERMKVRQVACITKPAKEDEPVPAHDFTVGIERVFFAPGILHKIATVLHPKIQKALKTVITLQCAARVMSSKGKLKKRMFDEKLRAERRRQALGLEVGMHHSWQTYDFAKRWKDVHVP